jgi:hypothetical protein
VSVSINQNRFVPPLEEMTHASVFSIQQLGIYAIELAHALRQIAVRCLNHQMVMVGHLTIGMENPIEGFCYTFNNAEKRYTVGIILINGLTPITTGSYMVKRTFKLDSNWSGHAE